MKIDAIVISHYPFVMDKLRHFLVRIQNLILLKIVTVGFMSVNEGVPLIRLGSEYGGWWIQKSIIEDNSKNRVLISAGLGFDVTFDEVLLEAGFEVIGLDPLQESVAHAKQILEKYNKFTGINMGLWTTTGIQKFFPPKNSSHDSWSATNIQNTSILSSKEFNVISFEDLFCLYPQLGSNDYCAIKMDVEGSEIELLPSVIGLKKKFDLLAVEMDFLSLIPFFSFQRRILMCRRARRILKRLEGQGYKLIMNEYFNFFWIQAMPQTKSTQYVMGREYEKPEITEGGSK